jgi:hypothetical protein
MGAPAPPIVRPPFGLHISPADLPGCVPVAITPQKSVAERPWLSRLSWRSPSPFEEDVGSECTADIGEGNTALHVLIRGSSCRTTFNNELCTSSLPL